MELPEHEAELCGVKAAVKVCCIGSVGELGLRLCGSVLELFRALPIIRAFGNKVDDGIDLKPFAAGRNVTNWWQDGRTAK